MYDLHVCIKVTIFSPSILFASGKAKMLFNFSKVKFVFLLLHLRLLVNCILYTSVAQEIFCTSNTSIIGYHSNGILNP